MANSKANFEKSSEVALRDEKLRKALKNTTNRFRASRKGAIEQTSEWEELRNKAREIKEHTIGNLDKYLTQLEDKISQVGGHVHWAKDAEEACAVIIKIARNREVTSVVKSKSMATEEIELNHAFEQAGIKVVETDLGEYILQLSDEKPSHIIAPAIHKSKDDISRLFSEKLNIPYYSEPEKLTKIAREKLRSEFLGADLGVTGVNFAVAETGTIVLVENEGNIRFTTTTPRIHVALMGIEKIIPKFEDLPLFLSVLMRSATGQKMSGYVSFITGPRRDRDLDGPKEFHLVLLDNGRTDILASEETRESLYCIRCGACLNICPVYRQVGGHSYGSIYSGPIGAIITPQLWGIEKAPDLPFASSLCGACWEVCPVKINIPKVLLELRKRVVNYKNKQRELGGFFESIATRLWRYVVENKTHYELALKIAYYLQRPWLGKDGNLSTLPFPFSRWTEQRDFPAFAKKPFREKWRDFKKQNE